MKLPHFNKVYLVAGWVEGQSGRRSFAGKVVKSTNALGRGWRGGEDGRRPLAELQPGRKGYFPPISFLQEEKW